MGTSTAAVVRVVAPAHTDPGRRVLAAFEACLDHVADEAVDAIFEEVAAYAARPELRDAVRATMLDTYRLASRRMGDGQALDEEDLAFVCRPRAPRLAGITPPDLLQAYVVGQRIGWAAIVALAGDDDDAREAVLGMAGSAMELVLSVAAMHVGDLHRENARLLGAEEESRSREVLEELLVGRLPAAGPLREHARRAGLDAGTRCVVVTAWRRDDRLALRQLALSLRRALRVPVGPLQVLRPDEVVLVVPVAGEAFACGMVERLRAALTDAPAAAVGVSTVHDRPVEVGAAYAEACAARSHAGAGSLVAFCEMGAVEYLALGGDDTARRMVRAPVRALLGEDIAAGGDLVATLRAYAAADLNATAAADHLGVHVNTVRNRLARIEERADCDLRRFSDVLELLVAARLHG